MAAARTFLVRQVLCRAPATAAQVAAAIGCTRAQVSRSIDDLMVQKLVERTKAADGKTPTYRSVS